MRMMMAFMIAIALTFTATAEAGPYVSGGSAPPTGCTRQAWNTGECDLVVVTPVAFGPIGSWLQRRSDIPQVSGARIEPLERGVIANGQYTMRLDVREFAWEMDVLCPDTLCEVAFVYGSRTSSALLTIYVQRGVGEELIYSLDIFDPSSAAPAHATVPSYAVRWSDQTPSARRMTNVIESPSGLETYGVTPNPTGALFSAQQPYWRIAP